MKKLVPLLFAILLSASCAAQKNQCIASLFDGKITDNTITNLCTHNALDCSSLKSCVVENKDIYAAISIDDIIIVSTGLLNVTSGPDYLLEWAIAHELSHYALNHLAKHNVVAASTSLVFTIADIFVPGVGLADLVINPSITKAFSRSQELDADVNAVKMLINTGIQDAAKYEVDVLIYLKSRYPEGSTGGIWASHPSWDDRISAVKAAYPVK